MLGDVHMYIKDNPYPGVVIVEKYTKWTEDRGDDGVYGPCFPAGDWRQWEDSG